MGVLLGVSGEIPNIPYLKFFYSSSNHPQRSHFTQTTSVHPLPISWSGECIQMVFTSFHIIFLNFPACRLPPQKEPPAFRVLPEARPGQGRFSGSPPMIDKFQHPGVDSISYICHTDTGVNSLPSDRQLKLSPYNKSFSDFVSSFPEKIYYILRKHHITLNSRSFWMFQSISHQLITPSFLHLELHHLTLLMFLPHLARTLREAEKTGIGHRTNLVPCLMNLLKTELTPENPGARICWWYCWWNKSGTRDVSNPVNNGIG